NANDFCRRTERRREPNSRSVRRLGSHRECHAIGFATVVQVHSSRANAHIAGFPPSPVSRKMRCNRETLIAGICVNSEKASEDRTYHHSRGPDLVWGTRRKLLEKTTGQDFGCVPKRAIKRQ